MSQLLSLFSPDFPRDPIRPLPWIPVFLDHSVHGWTGIHFGQPFQTDQDLVADLRLPGHVTGYDQNEAAAYVGLECGSYVKGARGNAPGVGDWALADAGMTVRRRPSAPLCAVTRGSWGRLEMIPL